MVRFRLIIVKLTFLLIFTCFQIFSASNLSAEPQRLFDGSGAMYWSNSNIEYSGLYPLFGGELMVRIWSECRMEDGDRVNRLQIVNLGGENQYDPPLQLNVPGSLTNGISSFSDALGNVFAVWVELKHGKKDILCLIGQKIDSEGELLWGEYGSIIWRTDEKSGLANQIGEFAPDDRGGFYLIRRNRILAFGNNGALRQDWQWSDQQPDTNFIYHLPIPDQRGGVWVKARTKHRARRFDKSDPLNHIDYEGRLLWKEPRRSNMEENLSTAGIMGDPSLVLGLSGGGLCAYETGVPDFRSEGGRSSRYRPARSSGIFQIDENGKFRGDKYHHPICQEGENLKLIRLQDNRILILYQIKSREEVSLWGNLYCTYVNKLLWGSEGVRLGTWQSCEGFNSPPEIATYDECKIALLENGDVIIPVGLNYKYRQRHRWVELYKISRAGKKRWKKPVIINDYRKEGGESGNIDGLQSKQTYDEYRFRMGNSFTGPGGRFWVEDQYGDDRDFETGNFNLYSNSGKTLIEQPLNLGTTRRNQTETIVAWHDVDGNYRILLFQSYLGYIFQVLNDSGKVIGSPAGQLVLPVENVKANAKAVMTEDMVLVARHHTDLTLGYGNYNPCLTAFDLNGGLLWDLPLDDEVFTNPERDHDLIIGPDMDHATVMFISAIDHVPCPVIFWVDLADGQTTWKSYLYPEKGRRFWSRTYIPQHICSICVDDSAIYAATWSKKDRLYVYKLDYNGELSWDEPYSHQEGSDDFLIDITPRPGGGIYVAKQKGNLRAATAWARSILPNGIRGRTTIYFSKKHAPGYSFNRKKYFTLFTSGINLWLIPRSYCGVGIQCVAPIAKCLLGETGWNPDFFHDSKSHLSGGGMLGCSDDNGGAWVLWNKKGLKVIHFDAEAGSDEYWRENGYPVFRASGDDGPDSDYRGFVLSEKDFIVTASAYDSFQESVTCHLQHIIDGKLK